MQATDEGEVIAEGSAASAATVTSHIQSVRQLQAHLGYLSSADAAQTMNVSLGGVVVTGSLVLKILTLVYSTYYGLLAYTGVAHGA